MTRYQVEALELRPIEVADDELMTLTEAAKRIGISYSSMTGLLKRGVLRRVVDTAEPNPKRAGRVLRFEVDAEIDRRRHRQDVRLKKSKRPRAPGPR